MVRRTLGMLGLCLLVASAAQAQGRYKLGGDGSCAWDEWDGGPNQCEPPPAEAAAVPVEEPVQTPAGVVDLEVIGRLVNAAATMEAWGLTANNLTPETLPLLGWILEDNGFPMDGAPRSLYGFGGGLGGGGSALTCKELYDKAQQWETFSRGLQKVGMLYGGGILVLSRMGPGGWWAATWVATGGFITGIAIANANWIAQDLRRQPCVA